MPAPTFWATAQIVCGPSGTRSVVENPCSDPYAGNAVASGERRQDSGLHPRVLGAAAEAVEQHDGLAGALFEVAEADAV